MEQLTQNLKNGEMELMEVPFPSILPGTVLVKNHFSVISAGTEGKSVKDARSGYIGKARARKEELNRVFKSIKQYGLTDTYRMVMNKLESPSVLGYSCAGEIIAVASDVRDFSIGDIVACGGNTASHAEVVCVPVNLCIKIPENVVEKHAAFSTIGAIALQGIRQADLRIGENCAVIGLGLIGQLTVQILNAAGITTIGIDVDDRMVDLAKKSGAAISINRHDETLEEKILEKTFHHGCDAVIITAGSDSTDPVDLAGILCRKKGKVIIVGAVPTGFKRANYFRKELELKMSSSYGPGRYDREYEEQGIDYPYAYVRWTENRNMEAFAELLSQKKVNPEILITHEFNFAEAPKAYEMIVEKTEPFTGIVLKYDLTKTLKSSLKFNDKIFPPDKPAICLIGAGSFAQNFLLPAMKGRAEFISVVTARPQNAKYIAGKYGFASCTGNADEAIENVRANTVFIATRHDSHAEYVMKAMKAGKNVFVEKPLCLHEEELDEICKLYSQNPVRLMVGFNRRFSEMTKKIKQKISGQVAMNYRINAGNISADHWIHDPSVGGGRIIGELCHFIDLCSYLSGSIVTRVAASVMKNNSGKNDTVAVQLNFANFSVANVSYFSNGNSNLSKERLEIFGSGQIAVLDDFSTLTFYGKKKNVSKSKTDKGHDAEVRAFLDSVKNGKPSPISFDEIVNSTLATFKVLESIAKNGAMVSLK